MYLSVILLTLTVAQPPHHPPPLDWQVVRQSRTETVWTAKRPGGFWVIRGSHSKRGYRPRRIVMWPPYKPGQAYIQKPRYLPLEHGHTKWWPTFHDAERQIIVERRLNHSNAVQAFDAKRRLR